RRLHRALRRSPGGGTRGLLGVVPSHDENSGGTTTYNRNQPPSAGYRRQSEGRLCSHSREIRRDSRGYDTRQVPWKRIYSLCKAGRGGGRADLQWAAAAALTLTAFEVTRHQRAGKQREEADEARHGHLGAGFAAYRGVLRTPAIGRGLGGGTHAVGFDSDQSCMWQCALLAVRDRSHHTAAS